MLQLWGLKAGKLKQMHRCGQMARLVAQRSQSPPPPLGECAGPESPPQALGVGETSSYQLQSRCVNWRPGLQGQSTTYGAPSVGATARKPLTLALPGACSTG